MNDHDRVAVKVGDRVRMPDEFTGIVVGLIDTGKYAPEFDGKAWDYLKEGILVDTEVAGLVHYLPSQAIGLVRIG